VSLKISARVFVPEMVMNAEFIRFLIVQKMQSKSAPEVRKLFMQTVQGWENQPNFLQKFVNSPNRISAEIWPSASNQAGKIYNYVNNGTPAHVIRPRRAKMLRFQVGYRAATRPRMLSSRAPSRFGEYASSFGVNHPGVEAREFDKTIVEEYTDTFVRDIQDVIKVAKVRRG